MGEEIKVEFTIKINLIFPTEKEAAEFIMNSHKEIDDLLNASFLAYDGIGHEVISVKEERIKEGEVM